ncbi:MAG: ATP-binding cassette domain-containing protein [Rhodocyclaceae bacterium]
MTPATTRPADAERDDGAPHAHTSVAAVEAAHADAGTAGGALLAARALRVGRDRPLGAALNFDIRDGTLLLVRGDNGAGKTTLLHTLAGTLPPQAGSLHFSPGLRRVHLPQHAARLAPGPFSVADLIALASVSPHAHPWIPAQLRCRLDQLSGGQRQRLVLAIACAQPCDLLLLDEPTQSLDAASRADFYAALASGQATPGTHTFITAGALVLVSHDAEAASLLDRPGVQLLDLGR